MLIRCDFSDDYCNWQVGASNEESGFIFQRTTSLLLADEDIFGPEYGHSGFEDDYFAYVTTHGTADFQHDFATYLQSPYLIGSQHPEECLEFWFEFPVRIDHNKTSLLIMLILNSTLRKILELQ